jgi:NAD(P)-dependent dehydrogenase (short-subunit alcohol dehydrogenase family)
MHFEAKKSIVVGGSAGMGRQVAIDVVDHGGSAVIVGRSKARVDDTVAELASRGGQAWGIAAELTDRAAVADVQRALSEQHADATLLVNAAGFFIPKPFVEYDEHFYGSYMDLDSIINIGSMWAHLRARRQTTAKGNRLPRNFHSPLRRDGPKLLRPEPRRGNQT